MHNKFANQWLLAMGFRRSWLPAGLCSIVSHPYSESIISVMKKIAGKWQGKNCQILKNMCTVWFFIFFKVIKKIHVEVNKLGCCLTENVRFGQDPWFSLKTEKCIFIFRNWNISVSDPKNSANCPDRIPVLFTHCEASSHFEPYFKSTSLTSSTKIPNSNYHLPTSHFSTAGLYHQDVHSKHPQDSREFLEGICTGRRDAIQWQKKTKDRFVLNHKFW